MPTALQPTPTQAVVQIRQYWRGEGLALHWDLTIWTSGSGAKGDEQKGYTYQVRGGMDTFEFEKFNNVPLQPPSTWRGSFDVGFIPTSVFTDEKSLKKFEDHLRSVRVVRYDPNWNCQNWVWHSLLKLNAQGYLQDIRRPELFQWDISGLKGEMLELLELWESGDI